MSRPGVFTVALSLMLLFWGLARVAIATHWTAPPEAKRLTNPVRATEASVKKGRELYMWHCAKCHGVRGLGDGPSVGSLRVQAGLNLTLLGRETDGELFWKISYGRGEMPPFELILKPEDRWHIVNFLRTLHSR